MPNLFEIQKKIDELKKDNEALIGTLGALKELATEANLNTDLRQEIRKMTQIIEGGE